MDAGTWAVVREAFTQVEEAAPAERLTLMEKLQPEVRAEVESLLAALAGAGRFLTPSGEDGFGVGETVGPYRLLEELGRGGMGVVYRAERNDGEFRREVALKVAGGAVFGPESERRFIRERQLLARLDHPGIVRLLDGGIHGGRRYFAMELVEGSPITTHCTSRGLDRAERLRLFRDVCRAVSYAHQHLILHRDLKPGNILVTPDGAVKVLDFGIARLVDAEPAEATATLLQPMSLLYASPEQLRGAALTLASDIYALGLLLYELLTGVNPRRLEGADYVAALRHALDNEAAPPSRVARGIPRDLDAIVGKAMAEDPARRYASVAELEADVARHLEGMPIMAVPPRAGYLLGRFVRRHRAMTAAIAILAAGLVLGAALWVRQADREARRFEDARKLVHTVIFEIQPELEAIPATLPLRRKLVEGSLEYLAAVSRDAGGSPALQEELAGAYLELSRIQGNPLYSNLGDMGNAQLSLQKAAALIEQALAAGAERADSLRIATQVYVRLAEHDSQRNEMAAAARHARQAVIYADRFRAARPEEAEGIWRAGVARFTHALAMPAGQWRQQVEEFQEAARLAEEAMARRPAEARYRRSAGSAYRRIAEIHAVHDEHGPALEYALRASRISDEMLAASPGNPQAILDAAADAAVLGEVYDYAGRDADSLPHYRRAMELLERAQSADPANVRVRERLAVAAREYANGLIQTGAPAEAIEPARKALRTYEQLEESGQLPPVRRQSYGYAWYVLGQAEQGRGNQREACHAYRLAAERLEALDWVTPLAANWRAILDKARRRAGECATAR